MTDQDPNQPAPPSEVPVPPSSPPSSSSQSVPQARQFPPPSPEHRQFPWAEQRPDPSTVYPGTPRNSRRQNRGIGLGTLAVCTGLAALLAGGVGAGAGAALVNHDAPGSATDAGDDTGATATPASSTDEHGAASTDTTVAEAAALAAPSVVTISVTGAQGAGSGSGIVLDDQGHVLTNTHVVTLGGTTADPEISVRLSDGSVRTASVVGTDPLSDLAVIAVDDADGLVPAQLGTSGDLQVGDETIAIGAPLGLDGTVTSGIVSALDRTISIASSQAPEQDDRDSGATPRDQDRFQFQVPGQQSGGQGSIYVNVIQTDASINQGNSGGALVDAQGRVIGINVAIASVGGSESGSIGVGFAIPIDYAQRVAGELIDSGEASHGFLGVQLEAAPQTAAQDQGAVIDSVVEGQPAAEAGLSSGDVITAVDDRAVRDGTSLTAAIREYAPGQEVTLTIQRGDEEEQVQVTLGDMAG